MKQDDLLNKIFELLEIQSEEGNSEETLKNKFWEFSVDEWLEKIGDLEQKYLLSRLKSLKISNSYELDDSIKTKNEQIVFWLGDLSCLCVDAVAIPASSDITLKKDQQNDALYFYNGMKLRQKCLSIMDGTTLKNDEVLITRSYNIPTDYIIHVNYDNLVKSIINILDCSRVNMIKMIAIHIPYNSAKNIKEIYEAIEGYLAKFGIMFHKIILVVDDKDDLTDLQDFLGEEDA